MAHWSYCDFENMKRSPYSLCSDGFCHRLSDGAIVYFSFEEVKAIASLGDGEEGYNKLEELFQQKHPQKEEDQKKLSQKEQSELERTVF